MALPSEGMPEGRALGMAGVQQQSALGMSLLLLILLLRRLHAALQGEGPPLRQGPRQVGACCCCAVLCCAVLLAAAATAVPAWVGRCRCELAALCCIHRANCPCIASSAESHHPVPQLLPSHFISSSPADPAPPFFSLSPCLCRKRERSRSRDRRDDKYKRSRDERGRDERPRERERDF